MRGPVSHTWLREGRSAYSKSHRPKDANEWSGGKALLATGSPFPPVNIPGSDKKYIIAECNNVSEIGATA